MPAITKNFHSQEIHPWNWYIPNSATKLLIATFPTDARNRKHDFFYCSSTNRFWEILSAVADHPIELLMGANGIAERKKILDSLNLGLTDMGKMIYRQQGSSKDHSLFPIEFTDIIQLLIDYPSIESLIVSGNIQGNSSLSWFSIFCSLNNIKINIKQLEKERATEMVIAERDIKLLLVFSPSRLSRVTTETLTDSYRTIIGEVQSKSN